MGRTIICFVSTRPPLRPLIVVRSTVWVRLPRATILHASVSSFREIDCLAALPTLFPLLEFHECLRDVNQPYRRVSTNTRPEQVAVNSIIKIFASV